MPYLKQICDDLPYQLKKLEEYLLLDGSLLLSGL